MADRPILFRGPLVRAILDGHKTVTRRLIKHEHAPNPGMVWQDCDCRDIHPNDTPCVVCAARFGPSRFEAGDRLWVRETWRTAAALDALSPAKMAAACQRAGYEKPWAPMHYEANDGPLPPLDPVQWQGWSARARPAIHMPRWASRLTLDVVSVRAERLQDITPEDALAEGITVPDVFGDIDSYNQQSVPGGVAVWSARDAEAVRLFRDLWDSINGKRPSASWDANPYVWRVEFKRAADVAVPCG